MKILLVGSPKTGNVWVEKLLAVVYKLPIIDLSGISQVPPSITQSSFIAHQHYPPIPELLEWGKRDNVYFVTPLRHPGDIFVSFYHYINNFSPIWEEQGIQPVNKQLIGKAIDSPQILGFMKAGFKSTILLSTTWLKSQRSLLVRYEDLKQSPVDTLKRLTDQIEPVSISEIEEALKAAHIDKLRQESELMRLHCRQGKVGGWQEELSEAHIAIFYEHYSRELELLGYNLDGYDLSKFSQINQTKIKEKLFNTPAEIEEELSRLTNQITELEEKLGMANIMLSLRSQEIDSIKSTLQKRDQELDSIKSILQVHEEPASIKPILQAREEELTSVKTTLLASQTETARLTAELQAIYGSRAYRLSRQLQKISLKVR